MCAMATVGKNIPLKLTYDELSGISGRATRAVMYSRGRRRSLGDISTPRFRGGGGKGQRERALARRSALLISCDGVLSPTLAAVRYQFAATLLY